MVEIGEFPAGRPARAQRRGLVLPLVQHLRLTGANCLSEGLGLRRAQSASVQADGPTLTSGIIGLSNRRQRKPEGGVRCGPGSGESVA
jgi:hypothetical protein